MESEKHVTTVKYKVWVIFGICKEPLISLLVSGNYLRPSFPQFNFRFIKCPCITAVENMYVGIPCRVCVVNNDVKKGNYSQKGIHGPERQRPELVPLQRGVSLTCTTMNVVREVFIGPPATPAACLPRLYRRNRDPSYVRGQSAGAGNQSERECEVKGGKRKV